MIEEIVIPITPQTHIRMSENTKVVFRIPEVCQDKRPYKERRADYKKTNYSCKDYKKNGTCKHCLSPAGIRRKKRILRYNQYKKDIYEFCKRAGFEMPIAGWALYFFIPMPTRWTKKKKLAMHGQHHLQKPDLDNLEKAFYDSLRIKDEHISQLSGHGKFWANSDGQGWILIRLNTEVYNPFNVQFIMQDRKAAGTINKIGFDPTTVINESPISTGSSSK